MSLNISCFSQAIQQQIIAWMAANPNSDPLQYIQTYINLSVPHDRLHEQNSPLDHYPIEGTSGNILILDINGYAIDSGVNIADVSGTSGSGGSDSWIGVSANYYTSAQVNNILSGYSQTSGTTYTNSAATPSPLGGIAAGSTFNNQSVQQMFDALLYPYQVPAFTSFAISGQSTPIEVGSSATANPNFTWGTSNSSNVSANSISLIDVTNSNTVLVSGLANNGSHQVIQAAISKNSYTSYTWKVQATNTHGTNFNTTMSVTWEWKRYYGEGTSALSIQSDITGLRVNGLSTGFAATYSFNAGGYKFLCYPSVLGTASNFTDQSTGLNVPFNTVYTINVTNVYGITTSYNVHQTTNMLGGSINIIVS